MFDDKDGLPATCEYGRADPFFATETNGKSQTRFIAIILLQFCSFAGFNVVDASVVAFVIVVVAVLFCFYVDVAKPVNICDLFRASIIGIIK